MFAASVWAHIAFGAFLALFFILYYINGEGNWKIFFEFLIGLGGNVGSLFLLDTMFPTEDIVIRLSSIASCLLSFLIVCGILLCVVAYIMKENDGRKIIRLRDILLGQFPFIKHYYETRAKEIDGRLSIQELEKREKEISKKEEQLESRQKYLDDELERIESLSNKKLKIHLPENKNITINKEYIDLIPSYIADMHYCMHEIELSTESILSTPIDQIDNLTLTSYFMSVATYISSHLFGGTSADARIHFRIYSSEKNGYIKLVAVIGNKLFTNSLTIIPYNDDSMIKKSYECKRALIKSINEEHNYQSANHKIWQDYMTYTFNGLLYDNKPYLTFGISVKNTERYKKALYLINYFRIENFLQDNIERINDKIDIASILYGGKNNV